MQALVKESVREAYLRREAALKREAEEKKKEAEFAQAEGEANIASEEERREALAEERSYLDMERLEMRDIKDEGEAENDRVVDVLSLPRPPPFSHPSLSSLLMKSSCRSS